MKTIKSCGVLVVRGRPIESFLLMIHPTRYDLPKGHVNDGETEIECALRELREETGITPEDLELNDTFRFETGYLVKPPKLDFQTCWKTLVIFLGYLRREVPINVTEHQSYRWFPWNPPHQIQAQTIDPLLKAVEKYMLTRQ
jgi:8-oxo-dGTP pyrophosphatase MutT (NUDIX family)